MPDLLQERVALAIASVIAVVAIVFAAVGVPGADDDSELAVTTASPVATAAATTAPATGVALTPTRVPATPAAPTQRALAAAPGSTVPPKPGAYRYRESSESGTTEETVRYADRGGGRQTESDDDAMSEIAWRDDGKFVLETTFGQPPEGFRCDWNPDVLEYKLPLATGSSWEIKASCSPGQGLTISIDARSEVVGSERIRVAGEDVDTWVVRSQGTLTFQTPQGTSTQKVTSDDRFSPKHGLSVRSSETTEGTDPMTGQNVRDSSRREILNLSPA